MAKENQEKKRQLHWPLILRDIWKNAWLVVLAGVIGFLSVFSYAGLLHTPEYKSTVTFAVSPKSNGSYVGFYSSLNTAYEMAEVFKEVFSSNVLKRMVQEDMGDPDLEVKVTAEVEAETNILRVSVVGKEPLLTHEMMNSVLKNYSRVSDYMFGSVVLDAIKSPAVPTEPSNLMNMKLWYAAVCVLAMGAMGVAIVLLSLNRDTIKTLEGGCNHMGQAPLGVLIHEKSGQKGLLINRAFVSFRFVEGVLQVAHKLRHRMLKDGKKRLLVTSVAENEGKSTLSANLALAMAKHGSKVALLDMDLRRPAQHKLFRETLQCRDMNKALAEGFRAEEDENLFVFSLTENVTDPGQFLHDPALEKFLQELSEQVDVIIMDSAPYTTVADAGMLLQYADGVVLCLRQDWVPGKVLRSVAQELEESQAVYMGYVLNDYIDNGALSGGKKKYEQYKSYES